MIAGLAKRTVPDVPVLSCATPDPISPTLRRYSHRDRSPRHAHDPRPTRPAAPPSPARPSPFPERMIVAPGRRHLPAARGRRRRRAAGRRRDRRRRRAGHELPGAEPVRRHADGHAGAPRRAPPLRSADRVVARRVTGLPVSVLGWGTAVPDGAAVERRPRSDASTPTTRGSSSAPASASAASPRRARRRRRWAPRPRPTRSSAPGSRPTDIDLLVVATASPDTLHAAHRRVHRRRARPALRVVRPRAPRARASSTSSWSARRSCNAGYDHVLIVGAETLSRITDPEDRGTVILFGDGARGRGARHARRTRPGLLGVGPRLRRLGRRRSSRSRPAAAARPRRPRRSPSAATT